MAERGAQVKSNTLTMNFSKARDKAEINWGDGTPATFHEQRSLAEHLYEAQGLIPKNYWDTSPLIRLLGTMMIEAKIGSL